EIPTRDAQTQRGIARSSLIQSMFTLPKVRSGSGWSAMNPSCARPREAPGRPPSARGNFFIGRSDGLGPTRLDDQGGCCSSSSLPPSPPAEKATTRQDQAGKSGADDGAGNGSGRVHPPIRVDIGIGVAATGGGAHCKQGCHRIWAIAKI